MTFPQEPSFMAAKPFSKSAKSKWWVMTGEISRPDWSMEVI